ncbi:hypothetical protein FRC08_002305 [Ceratobasidium sp. 394]|nr:hypothetical protein FRC08_002305 [Ceratobasidium sp. 394]KAG9092531.1 hypothetical protein FS749_015656 [Ceratobasidium sp. UAMH 11750]
MSSSNFNSLLSLPGTHATKPRLSRRLLPRLITTINAVASLDIPRVTAITVGAQKLSISIFPASKAPEKPEADVYQTLPSPTRFAIIVPPSVSRAYVLPSHAPNKQDPISVVPPTRPRRSITVQRLGVQTPSPPWAIRHMLTRGGGRFSLMSLPEFHRPASERLAVQYVEGKGDAVAPADLKFVYKGTHTRQTLEADLAPEQLKTFKYLVAERTSLHRLEAMDPLKLAVHNNLARVIVASSHPGHHKPNGQRMRRTRPNLPRLDVDAARAYTSTNPTSDSPPESPGPVTPADLTTVTTRTSKEPRIAKDRAVPSKSSRKGVVHRVHSKGSKARLSRRF